MAHEMTPTPAAVPSRRRSLVEQELVNSLGWLISLRWLAGVTVLVAPLVATLILRLPVPAGPVCAVGTGILLYNAVLWWVLGWLGRERPDHSPAFESFARVQIG
ncbi:MAG: hypothetical protein NTY02_02755, partial [Acidobacteria bacterium]|nr:hypothetical protein [Acidobacteriota bacterium]